MKNKVIEIEELGDLPIAALGVGWLRDNADKLAKIGPNVTESVDGMVDVILASNEKASRKTGREPVSREALQECLTMPEAKQVLDSILEMSGLTQGGATPENQPQERSSGN